jgi:hypothetical protein
MSSPPLGKIMLDLAGTLPYRRNTRIPVAFPVSISGKDESGRPLQETTKTIDVGKHGIRIESLHPPIPHAEISIRAGGAGKAHSARVVWRGGSKGPDGRTEIGVEFLPPFDAEGLWAIKPPPDDWRNGPLALTTTQKLEYFTARHVMVPVRTQQDRAANDLGLPPLPMPVEPEPFGDRAKARSSWGVTRPPEAFQPGDQGRPLPAVVVPSSGETSARGPRDSTLPPMIEALPAEKGLGKGSDRPSPSVNSPRRKSPNGSAEELMSRLTQILTEQADAISKARDNGVSSVLAAAKSAVTELDAARKQIEESLQATSREYQKQLAALGAASVEDLRRNSQALQEWLQGELGKSPPASDEKVAHDVQYQFGKLAADLKGEFSRQQDEQELKYKTILTRIEGYTRDRFRPVPKDTPAARPPTGHGAIVWVLGFLVTAVTALFGFAYLSTQPVMRLRAEPPAEFLQREPGWNTNRQAAEQQLARSYWDYAVRNLQQTYTIEMKLPEQPPPEFKLDPQSAEIHFRLNLEASRQRYWRRLRTVWDKPEAWEKSYEWNTAWLGAALKPLGEGLRRSNP